MRGGLPLIMPRSGPRVSTACRAVHARAIDRSISRYLDTPCAGPGVSLGAQRNAKARCWDEVALNGRMGRCFRARNAFNGTVAELRWTLRNALFYRVCNKRCNEVLDMRALVALVGAGHGLIKTATIARGSLPTRPRSSNGVRRSRAGRDPQRSSVLVTQRSTLTSHRRPLLPPLRGDSAGSARLVGAGRDSRGETSAGDMIVVSALEPPAIVVGLGRFRHGSLADIPTAVSFEALKS